MIKHVVLVVLHVAFECIARGLMVLHVALDDFEMFMVLLLRCLADDLQSLHIWRGHGVVVGF